MFLGDKYLQELLALESLEDTHRVSLGTESDAYRLSNQVCNLNITVVHTYKRHEVWFWAGAWERQAESNQREQMCREGEKVTR